MPTASIESILKSDKSDIKTRNFVQSTGRQVEIIKGSTHRVDIKILDVYVPDSKTSKHMQQKPTELKGEIDRSTVMTGDVNTLLSVIGRMKRQTIVQK